MNEDWTVRYYMGRSSHDLAQLTYVADHLRRVEDAGIPVEVVADRAQRDIYEKDMKPQTRTIRANTGRTAAEQLKANSGNLHVHGTLALALDGHVQWIARHDAILDSLERLAGDPESALDAFTEGASKQRTPEDAVLDAFEASGVLDGRFSRRVPVDVLEADGERPVVEEWFRREIDLVCETEDEVWIIEAKQDPKKHRDVEALGQVLYYAHLFSRQHDLKKKLRMGVVFGPLPDFVFDEAESSIGTYGAALAAFDEVCNEMDVEVWVEGREF